MGNTGGEKKKVAEASRGMEKNGKLKNWLLHDTGKS